MFCAAVKINNNWIAILKGCFIPAAVLPLSIFPPAAGNCVPKEQRNVLTNVQIEFALLAKVWNPPHVNQIHLYTFVGIHLYITLCIHYIYIYVQYMYIIYTCMCVWVYVCIHTYILYIIHTYNICMHTYIYIYVYLYIYIPINVYITYIDVYMYIYMYKYTYIHSGSFWVMHAHDKN